MKTAQRHAYLREQARKIEYLACFDVGSNKNTGLAIWSLAAKKIVYLNSNYLLEQINKVKNLGQKKPIGVILENPNLDSPTFRSWAIYKKSIQFNLRKPPIQMYNELQKQFGIEAKKSQHVGKNMALADIVLNYCFTSLIPCVSIAPSKRNRRDYDNKSQALVALTMPTKVNADEFKILTNWNDSSNEHNRDAGTLGIGVTRNKFVYWLEVQLSKIEKIEDEKARQRKNKKRFT